MGGKHKGRILWRLGQGMCRYGELRRAITGITAKMLTQTLHDLVEDGLIERISYAEMPPRVEYHLTSSGRELLPVIEMLKAWGERELRRNRLPSMYPGIELETS